MSALYLCDPLLYFRNSVLVIFLQASRIVEATRLLRIAFMNYDLHMVQLCLCSLERPLVYVEVCSNYSSANMFIEKYTPVI
jgi:hypothetical protein